MRDRRDAVDLLRWFAGNHGGTKDALNVLLGYEKSMCSLPARCKQAKIIGSFTRK